MSQIFVFLCSMVVDFYPKLVLSTLKAKFGFTKLIKCFQLEDSMNRRNRELSVHFAELWRMLTNLQRQRRSKKSMLWQKVSAKLWRCYERLKKTQGCNWPPLLNSIVIFYKTDCFNILGMCTYIGTKTVDISLLYFKMHVIIFVLTFVNFIGTKIIDK